MNQLVVLFVAGGRGFGEPAEWRDGNLVKRDPALVRAERAFLCSALYDELDARPFDRLVHGACRRPDGAPSGADRFAELWALEYGIQPVGYPACFKARGAKAGPERTWSFLNDWHPAHECKLLALPGGIGTQRAVEMATGLGIPVRDERGWRPKGGGS